MTSSATPETASLFPALHTPPVPPKPALRFGDRTLEYGEVARLAGALARELPLGRRVAVWATPSLETGVAVVAALLAGVVAVPLLIVAALALRRGDPTVTLRHEGGR